MQSLLETYLSEVAAQLQSLPAKRREEELREMRAHLESAVAAGREQGQTEDEAAATALEQFGAPQAVGQETVTAWRRGVWQNRRSFWSAAACTLALLFLVPFLLELLETRYFSPHADMPEAPWMAVGFTLAGPLLAGVTSGLLFSKRMIAGTAFGAVLYSILCLSLFAYMINHAEPSMHFPARGEQLSLAALGLTIHSIQVGLVTLFAAWAGSRWRERRWRLVRQA